MELVYRQMVAARQKYGDEVYNKTLSQLIEEFGKVIFPPWISKFNGCENPQDKINLEIQLGKITENFCYKGQSLGYEEFLTPGQKTYFQTFKKAFEYRGSMSV